MLAAQWLLTHATSRTLLHPHCKAVVPHRIVDEPPMIDRLLLVCRLPRGHSGPHQWRADTHGGPWKHPIARRPAVLYAKGPAERATRNAASTKRWSVRSAADNCGCPWRAQEMKSQGSFLRPLLTELPSVTFLGLQLQRTPVVNGQTRRTSLVVAPLRTHPTHICVVQQRVRDGTLDDEGVGVADHLRWACYGVTRS